GVPRATLESLPPPGLGQVLQRSSWACLTTGESCILPPAPPQIHPPPQPPGKNSGNLKTCLSFHETDSRPLTTPMVRNIVDEICLSSAHGRHQSAAAGTKTGPPDRGVCTAAGGKPLPA